MPIISGFADAPVNSVVTVTINDVARTTKIPTSGNWMLKWPASLPQGTYRVSASVTDAAGNTDTSEQVLMISGQGRLPRRPLVAEPEQYPLEGSAEADFKAFTDRWRIYDYRPGILDRLSFGRYGGHQAVTFFVATKTESSTGDVLPQLGQYRQAWQTFEQQRGAGEQVTAGASGLESRSGERGRRITHRLQELPGTRGLKRVMETVRRRLLPRPMPPVRMRL